MKRGDKASTEASWADWAQRAVDAQILERDAELIVGFDVDVDDAQLAVLCNKVGRLLALICDLPRILAGGSIESFARLVGVPPIQAAAVAKCSYSVNPTEFGRADVIHTLDGFRVLELNVGATVGGMVLSSLPAICGGHQPGNSLDSWAKYIARRLGPEPGRGVIVDGTAIRHPSPWPRYTTEMANALNRAGLDCGGVCVPKELKLQGEFLCAKGPEPIRWIYPIWFPWHFHENSIDFAVIEAAIANRYVVLPVDPSGHVLSSKSALALLHLLADEGNLPPNDVALVRNLIPETRVVEATLTPRLLREQPEWVLKPALGHGGHGVVIGDQTAAEKWIEVVESAADNSNAQYIAQRRCFSTVTGVTVYSSRHGYRSYSGIAVWGFYIADGTKCGDPVLRVRPASGSAVVNFANGAAAGPFMHKHIDKRLNS
jgi:hypothetical protein